MVRPIKHFAVCVRGLPDGFVPGDIANAVSEFVGGNVSVLSTYPNQVKLLFPQHCATHVIKMLVEMHLNAENAGERQSVDVTIV